MFLSLSCRISSFEFQRDWCGMCLETELPELPTSITKQILIFAPFSHLWYVLWDRHIRLWYVVIDTYHEGNQDGRMEDNQCKRRRFLSNLVAWWTDIKERAAGEYRLRVKMRCGERGENEHLAFTLPSLSTSVSHFQPLRSGTGVGVKASSLWFRVIIFTCFHPLSSASHFHPQTIFSFRPLSSNRSIET